MDFEDEDRRKQSAGSQAEGSTQLATTRAVFIENQAQWFGHYYDLHVDKKELVRSRIKSQTFDCSILALQHYNKEKGKSYTIDMQWPMDSNAFHVEQLSKWYVHVNFWALSNSGTRMLFFAELEGEHGPNEVEQITLIGQGHNEYELKATSAENICPFCTGILHPRYGNFIGHELALMG